MPLSDHRQLTPVLDIVMAYAPHTVLDVGVGHGAYGTLLRQYLGQSALIVGVEPYEPYGGNGSGDRWWAYDAVVAAPWPQAERRVVELLGYRATYDVTLAIDVVEHVPPADRTNWLEALAAVSSLVIVATPHDPERFPQTDMENELERHYPPVSLSTLPGELIWSQHLPDSYIAVLRTES